MNKTAELIYEIYGEITRRCFDWKDVEKMLEDCTSKFGKNYFCELNAEELREVLEDLKGEKMGNKRETLYEIYEKIVDKYKGWEQIGKMVKQIAKRYEKQFVCELSEKNLREVLKELREEN